MKDRSRPCMFGIMIMLLPIIGFAQLAELRELRKTLMQNHRSTQTAASVREMTSLSLACLATTESRLQLARDIVNARQADNWSEVSMAFTPLLLVNKSVVPDDIRQAVSAFVDVVVDGSAPKLALEPPDSHSMAASPPTSSVIMQLALDLLDPNSTRTQEAASIILADRRYHWQARETAMRKIGASTNGVENLTKSRKKAVESVSRLRIEPEVKGEDPRLRQWELHLPEMIDQHIAEILNSQRQPQLPGEQSRNK